MEKPTSTKAASAGSAKMIVPALLVLLALSVAGNGYLFMRVNKLSVDPQAVAKEEVAEVIAKVGQLMALPTDEEPTIATVTDPDQLKTQAFFANAQKGFKVLLYAKAKKAVLYDPFSNKIIEVAPINIGNATDTAPADTDSSNTTPSNQ